MDYPAAAELQEMRLIAAQCRAQALIARQQGGKYAPYYRVQAEHFRMLAASTRFPNVQATRLLITTAYERLAEQAESMAGSAPPASPYTGALCRQRHFAREVALTLYEADPVWHPAAAGAES